jgi:hypothetical protein
MYNRAINAIACSGVRGGGDKWSVGGAAAGRLTNGRARAQNSDHCLRLCLLSCVLRPARTLHCPSVIAVGPWDRRMVRRSTSARIYSLSSRIA